MTILIILVIVIILLFICLKVFKRPKFNTINFVDGAPGVGKSQVCVYWAIKEQKKTRRQRAIKNYFRKLLKKDPIEKGYLYSNLNLKNTPFVTITEKLLLREDVRCGLNSTAILDEMSLVADQNIFGKGYEKVVEQMRDFWKLCRHEGFKRIFVNSQSISSINYTLKDCIGSYFYIHHRTRLPFFSLIKLREMQYSRDLSSGLINTSSKDVEDDLKTYLVPNYIFKKYDSRAYSVFTDMLPVDDNEKIIYTKKNLKMKKLVSFMPLNHLYTNLKKQEKLEEERIKTNEQEMGKEI